jgi:O-antigen/teichoic acid export membrane protein
MGGLATAGLNILLPAVVVHHLSSESFAVWNLALQILVYVNLLSLGLQTATARAVAHAADAGVDGMTRLPGIARAARSIAHWASVAALVFVVVLVAGYPLLFPDVSPALLVDFRMTLALFGLAAALQILAQPDMGIFQGLHRNAAFVSVQMAIRLLTVLAVWLGVQAHQPMLILAILMAAVTALLWPAIRAAVNTAVPWARAISAVKLDRAYRRELLQYCGSLSVWSLSMLLLNSVGILIVGRIDLLMVGPYAIAMTAASVLVGLLGAALSPLMTNAAALHATETTRIRLPKLLYQTTLGAAITLNLLAAGVAAMHPQILRAWVGESFVSTAGPILVVVVSAHCLRNIAAPYSLMLLATGLHRRALFSAILEGLANLIASVVLGIIWGAIGVAYGTFIGSIVGVVGTLVLNTKRTPELTPRPLAFVFRAVVLPVLLFAPLHLYLLRPFI